MGGAVERIHLTFNSYPHLSASIFLSPSRSQPISLCLSLCHSQPITCWLQVLNLRPHYQLAHYVAALNLFLVPSSSFSFLLYHFLCFWSFLFQSLYFLTSHFSHLTRLISFCLFSVFLLNFQFFSCSFHLFTVSFFGLFLSLSTPPSYSSLSPSALWPPHSANCYNSIVPFLAVGSNGINKAGFEIDFLSAPF